MASSSSSALVLILPLLWLLFFLANKPKVVWAGEFEEKNVLEMVTMTNETSVAAPVPVQFSHYILALQWPPSICTQVGRQCRDITVPRRFTIHGLWPANSNGVSLENCDPNSVFDWFQISSLDSYPQRELNTKWPTLSNSITQQAFFRKEWMKHGTCSGLTQLAYFQLALRVYDSVNLYNRLADRAVGVVPSARATYNPTTVITNYNTKWNLLIKFKCVNRTLTPLREMIGEIHSQISRNGATVQSITGRTNMCLTTAVQFPERA